jgi:hypothetical protein
LIRIEKNRFVYLFFWGTHFFFLFSNHFRLSLGDNFAFSEDRRGSSVLGYSKGRSAANGCASPTPSFLSAISPANLMVRTRTRYIYDSKRNVTQNIAERFMKAQRKPAHQIYTRDISRHKTGDISC